VSSPKEKKNNPPITGLKIYIRVFPKIKVPQNGWSMMEIPIRMDDLGVPLFLETPIYIYYRKMRKSQLVVLDYWKVFCSRQDHGK